RPSAKSRGAGRARGSSRLDPALALAPVGGEFADRPGDLPASAVADREGEVGGDPDRDLPGPPEASDPDQAEVLAGARAVREIHGVIDAPAGDPRHGHEA